MKLLIFDIDGTLTHLDGATSKAFVFVFGQLFQVKNPLIRVPMHGRTDPMIFRDFYHQAGLPGEWQDAYQLFRSAYIDVLPDFINATTKAKLHPGVEDLIRSLDARRDKVALALGTGNMEAGARKKVGHFGLNDFFPVGGFGDTHHVRADIMRDAIRNAEAYYKCDFPLRDCWVIGDTIYDIEGGKAVGARTLGVATGGAFTADDLRNAGADAVFDDLSDTSAVLQAMGVD